MKSLLVKELNICLKYMTGDDGYPKQGNATLKYGECL